jgi:uncharacterized membrane protein
MNDPIGVLLALLSTGTGAFWMIYPERGLKPNQPDTEQRRAKIKKFKLLGLALFLIGVSLLALHLTG